MSGLHGAGPAAVAGTAGAATLAYTGVALGTYVVLAVALLAIGLGLRLGARLFARPQR